MVFRMMTPFFRIFFEGVDYEYVSVEEKPMEIHLYFILHFFESCLDLLVYLLSLPFLCIGFYRWRTFWSTFYQSPLKEKRRICLREDYEILLDIPFILLFLLILPISSWRYYFIYQRSMTQERNKDGMRWIIWEEFLKGCLDSLLIIFGVLLYLTGYRWDQFVKDSKETSTFLWKVHFCAIVNGLYLLRDLVVHLIFLPPLLISIYRVRNSFYSSTS
jgi:NADH:ubiquinone oxidoreductase subunit 5 (subunit L)/multisubunit Na+/H+ antiporter MnhA subunit